MTRDAPVFDPLFPELMFAAQPVDLTKTTCNIVGCGMGFSDRALSRFKDAVAADVPLIVDADALRILARDQALQDALLARKAHTVITPHPGEAAELLHRSTGAVLADRIGAARELSVQTGAITVLKGAGTVISLRSSRTWINPVANGSLATAGSGDALSGILGAFFAQGFDLVTATLGAVWLHSASVQDRTAGVTAGALAPRAAALLDQLRRRRQTRAR